MAKDQTGREYYDLPFIYVYDANALTDGNNYSNLSLPTVGDSDFLLRMITGYPNVATGGFRFRDMEMRNRLSTLVNIFNNYVVTPDIPYRIPGSQITFDLGNVQRANVAYVGVPGSVPNYYSQLAFQGVKRFYGYTPYETPYRWFEQPYTISTAFVLSNAGNVAPGYTQPNTPVRYTVPVDNYDFEMQKIVIMVQPNGAAGYSLASNRIKLTLYAQPGEMAMMSAPVVDRYLNANDSVFNSMFPVPPVVYPANSTIIVDVVSLLNNLQVPANVTISFVGMWRYPC